jgi:hypothetical protein
MASRMGMLEDMMEWSAKGLVSPSGSMVEH